MSRISLTAATVVVALALFPAAAAAQQDHTPDDFRLVEWKDLVGTGSKIQFYGFLRADSIYDDSRMNDAQAAGYVLSEDPLAPSGVGAMEDDSEFTMHARLTRFGMNFTPPPTTSLAGATVSGNIEFDFYNIGLGDSDSRSAIRMRKAYINLKWDEFSLRAGQDWDWISPLMPAINGDLVMWGAGNTGDRRPQLTGRWNKPVGDGSLETALGVGLAGAVSSSAVTSTLRSGENSGMPMVAGRVGWSSKTNAGGRMQAGLWGHWSEDEYDPTGMGVDDYSSNSVGLDVVVPIISDKVWMQTEVWTGKNLDDIRGGIFQGVSTTGVEIESTGGFVEVGWKATPIMTIFGGFSTDDPNDDDLDANAPSDNQIAYVAANWKFDAVRIGLELSNWVTSYSTLEEGDANRISLWIAYYF
jgi:hypothetical protein